MGKELSSEFYNTVFTNGGSEHIYFKNYDDTPWYPVWTLIIKYIINGKFTDVLDIGCGPSQFARYLRDSSKSIKYTGIDFSEVAISMAKELTPEFSFRIENAITFDYASIFYNVVVITEFLEHISGDLDVLNNIKSGTHILATLPNMDSDGHIRFLSKDINIANSEIILRYSELCNIIEIIHVPYEENPTNADYLIIMIKK